MELVIQGQGIVLVVFCKACLLLRLTVVLSCRLGNGFGALAVFYTTAVHELNAYEVDQWLAGQQWVNPVIAAGLSGMLYRCTSGPKTMVLAGGVGVLGMSAWVAAEGLFSSMFFSRPTRSSRGRRLPA